METWQFSLFFAALLVGYVLIHLRIVRFEEHLRGLATLRSIDERLAALGQQMPGGDPEQMQRIEAQLLRLHDDLEDLRETATRVGEQLGEAIVRIPQPVLTPGDAADSAATSVSAADRVRAVVEARLLQLGYGHLRLLTDLQGATLDGDIEVQVECERRNMPQKGRVVVRNGTIRDIAMQSSAPTFP
jgi:hypothetical protein